MSGHGPCPMAHEILHNTSVAQRMSGNSMTVWSGFVGHAGRVRTCPGVAGTSPDNAHAGRAVEVREAPGRRRQHPQPRRSISGRGRTASTAHFPCRLLGYFTGTQETKGTPGDTMRPSIPGPPPLLRRRTGTSLSSGRVAPRVVPSKSGQGDFENNYLK